MAVSEERMAGVLREATVRDVDSIVALLRDYAEQGLLLPRTRQSVLEILPSFRVIDVAGKVQGVVSLCILGDDLAEIRSLAVAPEAQGGGLGKRLVQAMLAYAADLQVPKVLALTYQEAFFARCGFHVVEKHTLHQKIWKDCINCKKFPVCDEIAMIYEMGVSGAAGSPADAGVNVEA